MSETNKKSLKISIYLVFSVTLAVVSFYRLLQAMNWGETWRIVTACIALIGFTFYTVINSVLLLKSRKKKQ